MRRRPPGHPRAQGIGHPTEKDSRRAGISGPTIPALAVDWAGTNAPQLDHRYSKQQRLNRKACLNRLRVRVPPTRRPVRQDTF